jgi:hypothetical protein
VLKKIGGDNFSYMGGLSTGCFDDLNVVLLSEETVNWCHRSRGLLGVIGIGGCDNEMTKLLINS